MAADSSHQEVQQRRVYEAFRYVLAPPSECRRRKLMEWFAQDYRGPVRLRVRVEIMGSIIIRTH
jgi:hypothetical protein